MCKIRMFYSLQIQVIGLKKYKGNGPTCLNEVLKFILIDFFTPSNIFSKHNIET